MNIPRPEHPKPQFQRDSWMNLNGQWAFEIDQSRSGQARNLQAVGTPLSGTITVPFCPESVLSGVGHTDFINGVWYKRTVNLTAAQAAGRTVLHFGAVDYECFAYVNGQLAGTHKGGYVSFSFDITKFVKEGENEITVYAIDDSRDPMIPTGKQCKLYHSYGCYYTRTTGIWQTVWLEFTPKAYINYVQFDTDAQTGSVTIKAELSGKADFTAEISYEGEHMATLSAKDATGNLELSTILSQIHLWELGAGRLYDVQLRFGEDTVSSYFGIRSVQLDGFKFLLNGKSVFQRTILDQGFYPDGIYTAPTDAALEHDIDMSMAMGFNGARPHEKIFEERYFYHADRKGYLVWGEYPNWGLDHTYPEAIYSILPEWLEEVKRDRNHPSIIGWCPFNETWDLNDRKQYDDLLRMLYRVTKAIDPSRPCIDTSGNFHVETDIFDIHNYDQDPVNFKAKYDLLVTEGTVYDRFDQKTNRFKYIDRQVYAGGPVFMSEFGGIRWAANTGENDQQVSWGYGDAPQSSEELKNRFTGLCDAMLDNPCILGFCYTQLTDVEQEQNGLYTYDRKPKFDPAVIAEINRRPAAIEQ